MAIDLRVSGTEKVRPVDPAQWRARCQDIGQHTYGRVIRWEPCSYCGRCPQQSDYTHPPGGKQNKFARTIDHIIPLSKGGSRGVLNQAPACYKCNTHKGNQPLLMVIFKHGGIIREKAFTRMRSATAKGSSWWEWSRAAIPKMRRVQ